LWAAVWPPLLYRRVFINCNQPFAENRLPAIMPQQLSHPLVCAVFIRSCWEEHYSHHDHVVALHGR